MRRRSRRSPMPSGDGPRRDECAWELVVTAVARLDRADCWNLAGLPARLVQEGVDECARHAQATQVDVISPRNRGRCGSPYGTTGSGKPRGGWPALPARTCRGARRFRWPEDRRTLERELTAVIRPALRPKRDEPPCSADLAGRLLGLAPHGCGGGCRRVGARRFAGLGPGLAGDPVARPSGPSTNLCGCGHGRVRRTLRPRCPRPLRGDPPGCSLRAAAPWPPAGCPAPYRGGRTTNTSPLRPGIPGRAA